MSKDLVTLMILQTEFEANILAVILRDHGIDAFVFASAGVGMGVYLSGGTVGVPLQVSRENVNMARQVLIENRRNSIDIDWDELELAGSDQAKSEYASMPVTARIAFFAVIIALLSGILVVILSF